MTTTPAEPVRVTLDLNAYGMTPETFLDWLRGGLGGEFVQVADDLEAQIGPPSKKQLRADHKQIRRSIRAAYRWGWEDACASLAGSKPPKVDIRWVTDTTFEMVTDGRGA